MEDEEVILMFVLKSSSFAFCFQSGTKVVDVAWLLDSISAYKLCPLEVWI